MIPNQAFPEIQSTIDPKTIPWHMSVVWSEHTDAAGNKIYEWLTKEHVRLVSWSNGLLSLQMDENSPAGRDVMYLVIQAPFAAVGRNMPV
ncbi:MAG: hypothetical protein ABIJ96_16110 [Elusimicrobiota bacterium]